MADEIDIIKRILAEHEKIIKINPKAKIIILTGAVESETRTRLEKFCTVKIFTKPYDIVKLSSFIKRCSKYEQNGIKSL